jgi:hypothetical protein
MCLIVRRNYEAISLFDARSYYYFVDFLVFGWQKNLRNLSREDPLRDPLFGVQPRAVQICQSSIVR